MAWQLSIQNLGRKWGTKTLRMQSGWTWGTGIRPSWEQADGNETPKVGEKCYEAGNMDVEFKYNRWSQPEPFSAP